MRASLAAHAPVLGGARWSSGPFGRPSTRDRFAPCSVHLSESAEEVEFIRTGGGPWRSFLEDVGAWNPALAAARASARAVSRRLRISRRARCSPCTACR